MATEKPVPVAKPGLQLSRGAVFPLLGGRSALGREHLFPIVMTILVGMGLFAVPIPGLQFSAKAVINEAWQVYVILALYIAALVNYYVYQMCGRCRSGWLIAAVAVSTIVLMSTPVWYYWYQFFYQVIPGTQWEKSTNPIVIVAGYYFGTGLCEEGFKALPLLFLVVLGAALGFLSRRAKAPLSDRLARIKRRIGISEPLDGIVLGVASGSGFFLNETLGQYVPNAMSAEKYASAQAFDGLVLLLARGLPDIAEHSAWSGLFGYFIGLSVLWPAKAKYLLPFGWLSAAALHGAWDSIDALTNSSLLVLGVILCIGLLSYGLLGGAIFKARELSPTLAFDLAADVALVTEPPPLPPPLPVRAAAARPRSDETAWD
jgi:RsiW-degrading membrane proteinase PrsW (M82 family)